MLLFEITVFLIGLWIVLATLLSAIRTFVLPRGEDAILTRLIAKLVYFFFSIRLRWTTTYIQRDRILALYPPVTLLFTPIVWMTCVEFGFTAMFWAVGERPLSAAFLLSGSSLLTLGFAPVSSLAETLLAFAAATLGLGLVALLIAYLPTMYTSFSNREKMVTMLDVRAGRPPSAIEMITRMHRLKRLELINEQWPLWEVWFSELEESHTTFSALVFFRSQHHDTSWISAAGTILDAAALCISTIDIPHDINADLCIRAGYLSLQNIAAMLHIPFNPKPQSDDPISVSREEFDQAYVHLQELGVPLVKDQDQAWRDWSGWRVNYDTVLLALSRMTQAPYSPWGWNERYMLEYRNQDKTRPWSRSK